jgi:hypothetical protein
MCVQIVDVWDGWDRVFKQSRLFAVQMARDMSDGLRNSGVPGLVASIFDRFRRSSETAHFG